MTALATAHEYSALGLPVLPLCPPSHRPCATPGKVPFSTDTGYHLEEWQRRGVPGSAEIDAWLASPIAEQLNLGLILGSYMRIDADGSAGFRILTQWSHGDLPNTWEFTTRSGAYAWLYRAPDGVTLRKASESAEGEHEGLELLGTGQQTAIPPSAGYAWAPARDPFTFGRAAQAPGWIVSRMSSSKVVDRNPSGWIASTLAGLHDGNRNDGLAKIGGWLRRYGATESDIYALLEPHALQAGLPPRELGTIARSIASYPSAEPFPKNRTPVIHEVRIAR